MKGIDGYIILKIAKLLLNFYLVTMQLYFDELIHQSRKLSCIHD